jgi:hypothetical protein
MMQYLELNPFAHDDLPHESREPLSMAQIAALTRLASEAWRSYVKSKLKGVQPRPVSDYVPWRALQVRGI